MAELDRKRRGELLYAVFDVLAQHPDGIQARDALAAVEQRLELTDFEKGNYPGTEVRRFEKTIRFQTINAVKAGWMVKEKGIWSATPTGLSAHATFKDPEQFMLEAELLYRAWKKDQPAAPPPVEEEEEEEQTASLTIEKAEETASAEIREFLAEMDPYDFQHLVAGLLRGMGYYVDHVAPPGKDRGVDIIANTDPLGTQGPRIKVQVKREQGKTDAHTLRAFMSVLKDNDVGAFVTLGGFTSDAELETRTEARRITLIGPNRLLDLWVEHYDSMPEEDKLRLPIRRIPFLALG
ncbi:MAG: restriction endonuclease [Actinomycetota bacterium]|nr:restriction endonuclease [Actinomycetota bacterium]